MKKEMPFIFGAQYYRAPTPASDCWEFDHRRMEELGFNAVKYWVQWRWSQRREGSFHFDDLDRLMDLAAKHRLGVTLNTILDVAPVWLYEKYPDAKQVDASGRIVQPYAVSHRQLGGHPGPCYNHPGALAERRRFMRAAIEHFKDHPALSMWDVWNEPEQSFQQRTPDLAKVVCYCANCRDKFIESLRAKYGSIERLNEVWGRCYEDWREVELPLNGQTIIDFVDWREFHLDTMTAEARWRLELIRKVDGGGHAAYLHTVPNTMTVFTSVSCVDDFDLALMCDVWGATTGGSPLFAAQFLSAGFGKLCYNAENHINNGGLSFHQKIGSLNGLVRDFGSEIGWGVRGFLYWQYRPESLGTESPGWGVVRPDGSDRPATAAARDFWAAIKPYTDELLACPPTRPEIGIWKSRKNEIFHFAINESLSQLSDSVESYIAALYGRSYPHRIISGQMLEAGRLEGIKLLIMPSCYYLTQAEADALDKWVQAGGVLLCEAHLGAYSATTGRHCRQTPGGGLAQRWGLREAESTSSYHLDLSERSEFTGAATADVLKAIKAYGTSGGLYFPVQLADGPVAWGALRYAVLEGDGLQELGSFAPGQTCIGRKRVGKGAVLYCGTNMGQGAKQSDAGLLAVIRKAAQVAGVRPTCDIDATADGLVHLDLISKAGRPRFAFLANDSKASAQISLDATGKWAGLFSKLQLDMHGRTTVAIPAGFSDLFVIT